MLFSKLEEIKKESSKSVHSVENSEGPAVRVRVHAASAGQFFNSQHQADCCGWAQVSGDDSRVQIAHCTTLYHRHIQVCAESNVSTINWLDTIVRMSRSRDRETDVFVRARRPPNASASSRRDISSRGAYKNPRIREKKLKTSSQKIYIYLYKMHGDRLSE
ncbi:hypothetical protein EVAR_36532_1 [Eumeta japonica]|uniref:Uncharacterized protein n=1 Tax=Eumeta variegata TaxID=151549 RepID=A0A4C1XBQ8_EUMVA|nr:hypothetical protein EVAR_36532_1 [Eumeta japonica]